MASAATEAAPIPKRLLNFFVRYPPKLYSAQHTGVSYSATRATSRLTDSPPSPPTTDEPASTVVAVKTSSKSKKSSIQPTTVAPLSQPSITPHNPFLPWKNPESGRWRGATVGLRTQADLVKIAKKHGVEALLPPGPKSTEFKEQRILEKGLRVKGTGEGQKVKGHKWERMMNTTLEKRRKAMEEMPEMIRLWKQVRNAALSCIFLSSHRANDICYSEVTDEAGRSTLDEIYNTTVAHMQKLTYHDALSLLPSVA